MLIKVTNKMNNVNDYEAICEIDKTNVIITTNRISTKPSRAGISTVVIESCNNQEECFCKECICKGGDIKKWEIIQER